MSIVAPFEKLRFVQTLSVTISTLISGEHVNRFDESVQDLVTKVVKGHFEVFCTSRYTHVVRNINSSGVVDGENQTAIQL